LHSLRIASPRPRKLCRIHHDAHPCWCVSAHEARHSPAYGIAAQVVGGQLRYTDPRAVQPDQLHDVLGEKHVAGDVLMPSASKPNGATLMLFLVWRGPASAVCRM
jgi:hypothetical protein